MPMSMVNLRVCWQVLYSLGIFADHSNQIQLSNGITIPNAIYRVLALRQPVSNGNT